MYHIKKNFKLKKKFQVIGVGETTQWVRALVAFPENLSSFSSSSGDSQPYVIPASGSPMLLSCVGTCTHAHTLTCSHMYLHEIKSLKRKFKILTFQNHLQMLFILPFSGILWIILLEFYFVLSLVNWVF